MWLHLTELTAGGEVGGGQQERKGPPGALGTQAFQAVGECGRGSAVRTLERPVGPAWVRDSFALTCCGATPLGGAGSAEGVLQTPVRLLREAFPDHPAPCTTFSSLALFFCCPPTPWQLGGSLLSPLAVP